MTPAQFQRLKVREHEISALAALVRSLAAKIDALNEKTQVARRRGRPPKVKHEGHAS